MEPTPLSSLNPLNQTMLAVPMASTHVAHVNRNCVKCLGIQVTYVTRFR